MEANCVQLTDETTHILRVPMPHYNFSKPPSSWVSSRCSVKQGQEWYFPRWLWEWVCVGAGGVLGEMGCILHNVSYNWTRHSILREWSRELVWTSRACWNLFYIFPHLFHAKLFGSPFPIEIFGPNETLVTNLRIVANPIGRRIILVSVCGVGKKCVSANSKCFHF